jgi:hypothetical protein
MCAALEVHAVWAKIYVLASEKLPIALVRLSARERWPGIGRNGGPASPESAMSEAIRLVHHQEQNHVSTTHHRCSQPLTARAV